MRYLVVAVISALLLIATIWAGAYAWHAIRVDDVVEAGGKVIDHWQDVPIIFTSMALIVLFLVLTIAAFSLAVEELS